MAPDSFVRGGNGTISGGSSFPRLSSSGMIHPCPQSAVHENPPHLSPLRKAFPHDSTVNPGGGGALKKYHMVCAHSCHACTSWKRSSTLSPFTFSGHDPPDPG